MAIPIVAGLRFLTMAAGRGRVISALRGFRGAGFMARALIHKMRSNSQEDDIRAEARRIIRDVVRSIHVKVDTGPSLRHLNDLQHRKIPTITAIALTRTAKELQKVLEVEMRRVFHQPTPWVSRGTFVKPATKQNLAATVGFKDRQSLYVKEHVTSGRRGQKPFEKAMAGMGILPSGFKAIPGAGMKLDSRGNPNRAQIKEIFGSLKSRMSRYGVRGKSTYLVGYFDIQPGNPSRLQPGIYKRINSRAIVPVMVFVPAAAYEKRLDMQGIAAKHAQGIFNREFQKAWAQYR